MPSSAPRVLFLSSPVEDYLADSLLHGLRSLLGAQVVDYPKREALYSSYPKHKREALYGHGFTLYGLLDDIPVERDHAIQRALDGEFDVVIFSDIWRGFGQFAELGPQLPRERTTAAVLDGSDRVEIYPYAGYWWRRPGWWFLPRAHTRFPYYKREITSDTAFFRWFMVVPRALAPILPIPRNVRPIAFSVPDEKITEGPVRKARELASHIVDPEVAECVGASTSYAFAREEEYFEDLSASRYGVTMRRAGWDAMRHYELAANGCVPCFRDLAQKPPLCPPYGLDHTNCVTYHDYADLRGKLDAIDDVGYERLQAGALAWARANSSRARATAFLQDLGAL